MNEQKGIHSTADVHSSATIGEGTRIWNWAQVRERAHIGKNCVISKSVYIDFEVNIGNNVKIQNNVSIYHGVTIEDGVFVGPHVCFTNDKTPRAINPDGSIKSGGSTNNGSDWTILNTLVKRGASIGANATILSGITIGKFAMIGAGSVVTKDVPDYGLAAGNPARLIGHVCKCGKRIGDSSDINGENNYRCAVCGMSKKEVYHD